ncbi:hypothetical protein [Arthrobacter bambusae]|uniref:hypothetical protein n=1 Tax=Arthrobacter bambusae TaxID=1338426 RepID=UPI0027812362|nr:hypothetical protein [Arthrobacter bambusae]MDQ0211376.1 hypothetical protein [Arthrobacter bambusae]MDQ0235690.1 hypothetical protein [Arthrobacter bambusae]
MPRNSNSQSSELRAKQLREAILVGGHGPIESSKAQPDVDGGIFQSIRELSVYS